MRALRRSAAYITLAIGLASAFSAADLPRSIQMVQPADAQPSGRARPPTEATLAYREAMTQLQLGMNIPYTGDADRDFAALLAAQAKSLQAIAAIQRQHGTDPKMRELAESVRAQAERDLAAATAWQAARRDP